MPSPPVQPITDPQWAAESNLARILALTGIFHFLAQTSVGLRLYVRIGLLRSPGKDDVAIVLAVVRISSTLTIYLLIPMTLIIISSLHWAAIFVSFCKAIMAWDDILQQYPEKTRSYSIILDFTRASSRQSVLWVCLRYQSLYSYWGWETAISGSGMHVLYGLWSVRTTLPKSTNYFPNVHDRLRHSIYRRCMALVPPTLYSYGGRLDRWRHLL